MPTEKKSFKKFASKHLAKVIENRRAGAKVRKEKKERIERKEKRNAKQQAREEADHAADLAKLKDTDPEFYNYLEEDDPTLLQYGAMDADADVLDDAEGSDTETDDDEEGIADDGDDAAALAGLDDDDDDDGEGEGDDEEGGEDDEDDEAAARRVTAAELDEVLKSKNIAAAGDLLISATRQLGIKVREMRRGGRTTRKFEEPALVKRTIIATVKLAAAQLPALLAAGKTPAFKDHTARNNAKRVVLTVVSVLQESSADGELCAQLCQPLSTFARVMHLIRGCTKAVLKCVLGLTAHAEETARVAAYMVVLTVAKRAAGSRSMYQSGVFKGLFLTLVKTAHKYTIHQLPVVGFLMNAVVDLYGTDMEAAYQHAYVYVRQLAVHLRAALQDQSQQNIRAVFNWQFLTALRTWGLVVSTFHAPQQLGPLVHPVVQVASGLLDLFASPRMFPMHLHVIEMLNHIASRSGVYIPVAAYVLRIITSPSCALNSVQGSKETADAVDLQFTMRLKKAEAKTFGVRVKLWTEALYLLTEHLATNAHSIGFPEAFWSVGSTLTKLKREVKVPKIHSMLSVLLKNFEENVKLVRSRRDGVNFGPCDVEAVKMFEDELRSGKLPVVAHYNALRAQRVDAFKEKQHNVRQQRTTLEAAVDAAKQRRPAGGKNRKPKRARD